MKVKLLKKLRRIGKSMINVHSVTRRGDTTTGMSYGYDYPEYSGLFEMGDSEVSVKEKAARVYLFSKIESIRKKYKKFSRKYQSINQ